MHSHAERENDLSIGLLCLRNQASSVAVFFTTANSGCTTNLWGLCCLVRVRGRAFSGRADELLQRRIEVIGFNRRAIDLSTGGHHILQCVICAGRLSA